MDAKQIERDLETLMNDVKLDVEDDGRWIAEVPTLPGVIAYGATREAAIANATELTRNVLTERAQNGE